MYFGGMSALIFELWESRHTTHTVSNMKFQNFSDDLQLFSFNVVVATVAIVVVIFVFKHMQLFNICLVHVNCGFIYGTTSTRDESNKI